MKTSGKLKNRNNLLMKLAGSTCRAPAPTLCGHRSGALLFSSRVLRRSLVTLCPHKSGRCAVELYHAPHLWYFPFYASTMASSAATLNRQPYEGRLPLTSWWRKSSNMTVGQSSLIFLTHHCYDCHPGSRCGRLDLQPVDIKSRWRHNWKSAQVVNSHLVCDPTIRQPGFDLPRQQ